MNPENFIVKTVRGVVRSQGFDVVYFAPPAKLLEQVDLILDVGANNGQSYERFRNLGYEGPIISFEPNPDTFEQLSRKHGTKWEKFQYALSNEKGERDFIIAESTQHSSFHRGIERFHGDACREKSRVKVQMTTIEDFWKTQKIQATHVYLKVDTEGHDLEVAKGAQAMFNFIDFVEMEICSIPRYEGESTFIEAVNFMNDHGFKIARIDVACVNRVTGRHEAFSVVFNKTADNAPSNNAQKN